MSKNTFSFTTIINDAFKASGITKRTLLTFISLLKKPEQVINSYIESKESLSNIKSKYTSPGKLLLVMSVLYIIMTYFFGFNLHSPLADQKQSVYDNWHETELKNGDIIFSSVDPIKETEESGWILGVYTVSKEGDLTGIPEGEYETKDGKKIITGNNNNEYLNYELLFEEIWDFIEGKDSSKDSQYLILFIVFTTIIPMSIGTFWRVFKSEKKLNAPTHVIVNTYISCITTLAIPMVISWVFFINSKTHIINIETMDGLLYIIAYPLIVLIYYTYAYSRIFKVSNFRSFIKVVFAGTIGLVFSLMILVFISSFIFYWYIWFW